MKAASAGEIKEKLKGLPQAKLVDLCLRLSRFKKENKELLTYLLFEANDLENYIAEIKQEITAEFSGINTSGIYLVKKSIRKILRNVNKHIRYTGSREAEVELLLYFCATLNASGIPFRKSKTLEHLYSRQVKKIREGLDTMHEDLQYEYKRQLETL